MIKINDFQHCIPNLESFDGIINLDIRILYPYSNTDVLSFGFGLVPETIKLTNNVTKRFETCLFNDYLLNHRYPNKNYFTVSRKFGRKISKTGYPFYERLEKINLFKTLILKIGIKNSFCFFRFNLDFELTKENRVVNLLCLIHNFEDADKIESNFGIDFRTYQPTNGGAYEHHYQLGKNHFGDEWVKEHCTDGRYTELIPCSLNNNPSIYSFDFIQPIILYAQPDDCIF